MIIRSKAPLRLGLAGGGSDVSPYSDLYGGLILNATINLYAYCTIEETDNGRIEIEATDIRQRQVFDSAPQLPIDGVVDLHKGVYNRIMRDTPQAGCRSESPPTPMPHREAGWARRLPWSWRSSRLSPNGSTCP